MHSGHAGVRLLTLPRNRIRPGPRVALLRVGDLEIDALRQNIRQGSREIRLSPGEHILLYTVAARAGEVVSYREVADALGPTGGEVRNNTIARHLSSLRRKLNDDAHHAEYIETVVGVGYRFIAAP